MRSFFGGRGADFGVINIFSSGRFSLVCCHDGCGGHSVLFSYPSSHSLTPPALYGSIFICLVFFLLFSCRFHLYFVTCLCIEVHSESLVMLMRIFRYPRLLMWMSEINNEQEHRPAHCVSSTTRYVIFTSFGP